MRLPAIMTLALGLSGCVSVGPSQNVSPVQQVVPPTPASALEQREWRAVTIDGTPASLAWLRLENGRASGSSGCNGFGGPYEFLPGQKIRFGTLATTRRGCTEAGTAQEKLYYSVLGDTMTYSVTGYPGPSFLTLTAADGRALRFRWGVS
jgi:heat shock protein HslJ